MVARYADNPQTDDADDLESRKGTSFENLRAHYTELEGLADMDAEQKIEVFQDVLSTLRGDLDSQQRA
ncbi:hypothetical protein [Bifidobacterium sp. ESL0732]|uniref:hypothetical protein n=1 Tax=Bifidobacterium sp. ESL0732 TaxID=2983222 RepID=UPI0023FA0085|nr:hypothetical protein [Bifidobacterium sp. ESL0732]WEV63344.1 hypothetical protein OZX70_05040 [Bifidobacterium sp. ESL0732]